MANDPNDEQQGNPYLGNIWGRKWTLVSLIVILVFMTMAVCRYLVVRPDRLVEPENVEQFGW